MSEVIKEIRALRREIVQLRIKISAQEELASLRELQRRESSEAPSTV